MSSLQVTHAIIRLGLRLVLGLGLVLRLECELRAVICTRLSLTLTLTLILSPHSNPNSDSLIGRLRLTFTIRSTCQVSTNTTLAHQPTDVVCIRVPAEIYILHCIALHQL